ncbi:DgyrCDS1132 [Dimorphilus gyrociliatus]|uniref:DgyrCDS1132 n=1 Tax=Dimorphilus gyrociliatus TaxID=2664684 RepID=A0A7I8V6N6_9ANNE|nr:DgyrCDS1132 [Dimorphilus gyrociliatus]
MEKRIELEKRGRKAEDITELTLDDCRATCIEGLTTEFKNLESLSLINSGLTTLKGFPALPNLLKLELSDNRISSGLEHLKGCPKLSHLNLSGNKLEEIETLEPLKHLQNLQNLDVFNCKVTTVEEYRTKVFNLLPQLKYLDGYDRDDEEYEEEGADEDEEEDDDEEAEDVEDEEEVEDEDDEVGLEYLTKDGIEQDSEGEEFEVNPEAEDEEDESEEEEEPRGVKRKYEDDEENV